MILFKKYVFELNYQKCRFLRKQIEFLRYIVTETKITLSPRHTNAGNGFSQPSSVTEVQRFLGLAGYCRRFIKNFAVKTRPLHLLLRKDVEFKFNENCKKSFVTLKKGLTSAPVLALQPGRGYGNAYGCEQCRARSCAVTKAKKQAVGCGRNFQPAYKSSRVAIPQL